MPELPFPLSVVVPNARAFPHELAQAITAQGAGDEVIVVRNQPEHGRDRWVTLDQGPLLTDVVGATVLRSAPGAAAARNAGWRAATHPWVLFLDDDIDLQPATLDAIRSAAQHYRRPGVLTLRVTTRPGPSADLVTATVGLDRGPDVRTTADRPVDLPDTWRYGAGAALVAHRDVLVATGGFKDHLGAGRRHGGAEDLEFLWHASRHCDVHYRGDIAVEHKGPDNVAEVGRKLRHYGRALANLAGSAGGLPGRTTVRGYCTHVADAARRSAPFAGPAGQQAAFRAAALAALAETARVYLATSLRRPPAELLCARCRPR